MKIFNIRSYFEFNTIIISSLVSTILFAEEPCLKEISNKYKQEMLIGLGEATTYNDAKLAAMADAISFLGITVNARSEIIENSNQNNLNATWTLESETKAVVKGASVLSSCVESSYKVTVGIPKTTIAKLIDQNCLKRISWLKEGITTLSLKKDSISHKDKLESLDQLKKNKESETQDQEAWIVIGRSMATFKSMPQEELTKYTALINSKIQSQKNSLSISARGNLAKATLSVLVNRLSNEGLSVTLSESETKNIWECSKTEGSPIGKAQRFTVTCLIQNFSDNFNAITVDGISPAGSIDETAVKLITDRLLAH